MLAVAAGTLLGPTLPGATSPGAINVRNLNESGRLQPIGAFPDGTPYAYRIVDPRLFILSASFDL